MALSAVLLGSAGLQIARAFPPEMRAAAVDAVRSRPRLTAVAVVVGAWILTYALYSLAYPQAQAVTDGQRASSQELTAESVPLEPAAVTTTDPTLGSQAAEVPLPGTTPVASVAAEMLPPAKPTPEPRLDPAEPPRPPAQEPESDPCTEAIAAGDVAAVPGAVETGCQRSES